MNFGNHKIEITNGGSTITHISVDGEPLQNATGYHIYQRAGDIPIIEIRVHSGFEFNGNANLNIISEEVERLKERIIQLEKENKSLKSFIS